MLVEIVIALIGVVGLLALGRLTFILFHGWVAIEVEKHREDSAD